MIEEAGRRFPLGLFSTLQGTGAIVGERLVTHPAVRKVSFTGGTRPAATVARKAAEKLMPVSLELGGKSPTIVFADADLDIACSGVMFGVFSWTGRSSCMSRGLALVRRAQQSTMFSSPSWCTANSTAAHWPSVRGRHAGCADPIHPPTSRRGGGACLPRAGRRRHDHHRRRTSRRHRL